MTKVPNHPWINTSEAPLYVLTYPSHDSADEKQTKRCTDLNIKLYQELERWTREVNEPYVFIVDLSQAHSSPMNRQRAAEYLERIKKRGNSQLAGRAFITPDNEKKGIVTAVFWISSPDYPHEFFVELTSAKTWGWTRLAEATIKKRQG